LLDAVALGPTVLNLQTNRLSGGERQRVAIARALAAEPDLLVCDEITSALDVSVQGSIVALLEDLRTTRPSGVRFVTHNLALGGAQIAVGAHIGGFILGVALANPLLLLRYRRA
jgi:peptide/nickel transport system ATP-binding protein